MMFGQLVKFNSKIIMNRKKKLGRYKFNTYRPPTHTIIRHICCTPVDSMVGFNRTSLYIIRIGPTQTLEIGARKSAPLEQPTKGVAIRAFR